MSHNQSAQDRSKILANLPEGTRRVQVLREGRQLYRPPEEVDVAKDEIVLTSEGAPVVMMGRPGRKPKSKLRPVSREAAEVNDARRQHVEESDLRREAEIDCEGDALFDSIIKAMAEEVAALEFEREEAGRHGVDTSELSTKRARVLKSMADTILKRQSMAGGIVDLDSPAFKALFSLMLETFKESMLGAGCRSEQVEAVFAALVRSLGDESFKQEAKSRMKEKLV